MKQDPVPLLVYIVLRSGPDFCLAAVALYYIGGFLGLYWMQTLGVMCLTFPSSYIFTFYVTRRVLGGD
jgi:hypothetical protein